MLHGVTWCYSVLLSVTLFLTEDFVTNFCDGKKTFKCEDCQAVFHQKGTILESHYHHIICTQVPYPHMKAGKTGVEIDKN